MAQDDTNTGAELDTLKYPIHAAALAGDYELLQQLLRGTVVLVDSPCPAGRTALLYAVMGDSRRCVELLLQAQANIHVQDNAGLCACHWAASQESHKMLKFLLERGADWTFIDNDGRTALHWCTLSESTKCLTAILKQQAVAQDQTDLINQIDIQDLNGMTALHWCAMYGKPKHVALLLRAGASPAYQDSSGKTPLHIAAENGDELNTGSLLSIENIPVNARDNEQRTPLLLAVAGGHTLLAESFCEYPGIDLDAPDALGRTALHWAAASAQAEIVSGLLQAGAEVSKPDKQGATALHYASQANAISIVNHFLSYHAEHIADHEGRFPLHWAAMQGDVQIVDLLISRDINVNLVDAQGLTCLHLAAISDKEEMITCLVEHNADLNPVDSLGKTPLLSAAELGLTHRVAQLIDYGCDLASTDSEGRALVHWAAIIGDLEILQKAVQRESNLDQQDLSGKTALVYACHQGRTSVVDFLISQGASVNMQDKDGICSLHWAALEGYLEIVQMLVDAGAFLNYREEADNQSTPLDYAVAGNHQEIIAYLRELGALSIVELQEIAATNIQATWRGHQTRISLKRQKLEMESAEVKGNKKKVAKSTSPKRNKKEIKSEQHIREITETEKKHEIDSYDNGTVVEKENAPAHNQRQKTAKKETEGVGRASFLRRFSMRKNKAKEKEDDDVDNAEIDMIKKRLEKISSERNAATKIQAVWKGYIVRKNVIPTLRQTRNKEIEGKGKPEDRKHVVVHRTSPKNESTKETKTEPEPNHKNIDPALSSLQDKFEEALLKSNSSSHADEKNNATTTLMESYTRYIKGAAARKENDRKLFQKMKKPMGSGSLHNELTKTIDFHCLVLSKKQHEIRIRAEQQRRRTKTVIRAAETIQRAWRSYKQRLEMSQIANARRQTARASWNQAIDLLQDRLKTKNIKQRPSHTHENSPERPRKNYKFRTEIRRPKSPRKQRALPTVARGVGAYESSLWKGDSSMVILHRLAAPPADTSADALERFASSLSLGYHEAGMSLTTDTRPKSGRSRPTSGISRPDTVAIYQDTSVMQQVVQSHPKDSPRRKKSKKKSLKDKERGWNSDNRYTPPRELPLVSLSILD
eukprot:m.84905 g.84905  ORF g.84905 m.84905 type:complete len:1100 (+) comp12988_c0_seq2:225-3524(+)